MVWVLTQDLFYYSKLNAVAERRGVQIVRVASYSARPAGPPPGLAVLDLCLPLLDEIDPVASMREASGRPTLPVVAYFSHVESDKKRKAMELGCGEVLPKSVFADRFDEMLSRYFPPSVPAP